MGSIEQSLPVDVDVLIIGAGISGINAAYHVQKELPNSTYTILEARNAIGGTWDLFRYPGIRSDSDLHTFGFPWRAWQSPSPIAGGESIRKYMRESAEEYGIDKKIRFRHKLLAGDWSSEEQKWILTVDADGEKQTFRGRFMIMGTGYYNYNEPLHATIPGIKNFKGTVVHPQFWPKDLDHAGKRIIIIGSGATAITLLPALAETAANVTMLQRSPSYIVSLPQNDPIGNFIRRIFPTWLSSKLVRWKFMILPFFFLTFCRSFPNAARSLLKKGTEKELPKRIPHDPAFKPVYNPWDQRMCLCPDGDFFQALRNGNADIVTDTIKTVTETGILTSSGKTLDADIIVTATGLKLQMGGGAKLTVDGSPVVVAEKFLWRGIMLQDLPNAAFVIGYTNASWTLGAEATARLVCRLLKHMQAKGFAAATPRVEGKMGTRQVLDLNSTYIMEAKGDIPMAGDRGPWRPRKNFLTDGVVARWGGFEEGLEFESGGRKNL